MIIGEVVELSREVSGLNFFAILRGGASFFLLPLGGSRTFLDTSDEGRHLFVFCCIFRSKHPTPAPPLSDHL